MALLLHLAIEEFRNMIQEVPYKDCEIIVELRHLNYSFTKQAKVPFEVVCISIHYVCPLLSDIIAWYTRPVSTPDI